MIKNCIFGGLMLSVLGCSDSEPPQAATVIETQPAFEQAPAQPASPVAAVRDALGIGKSGELKKVGDDIVVANLARTKVTDLSALSGQQLRKVDIMGTDVSDLSPLAGQPIEELYAEQSQIQSIDPLRGMPLATLYLSETSVADLSPVGGQSFVELNLVDTQVADLSPLKTSSLGTLWLRRTPVEDISPLASTGLVSLDIGETKVADLKPLGSMTTLRRLHIAESNVTDLTPIAGLALERLIFSPWKIEKGLDEIRGISTLQQLDVSFDDASGNALKPEEFWKRWDAGEIKQPASSPGTDAP